jgi:hypothetical protein
MIIPPRNLKLPGLVFAAFFLAMGIPSLFAQGVVDQWRYQLKDPGEAWAQPGLTTPEWSEGKGGFGTRNTPGARVGTEWGTNQIWLRKSFDLESVPDKPALLIHHDEDAEVYLNGKKVGDFQGFLSRYKVVPLDEHAGAAVKAGRNVMAVHCIQKKGGQFIDVHLIDADQVPEDPRSNR